MLNHDNPTAWEMWSFLWGGNAVFLHKCFPMGCGIRINPSLGQSTGGIPAVAGGQPLAVGLAAACCGVGHAWCTACAPWVTHFANFGPYLAAAHCEKF